MDEKKYHYHGKYQELFWITCKCCGREMEYKGRGCPKTYCETCLPQITALKQVLNRMKHEKDNAKICKQWYDNNKEIIVAVTCIFCEEIILGGAGKKVCNECMEKWSRAVPRWVVEALRIRSSFHHLKKELRIWKHIIELRAEGVTKLTRRRLYIL